MTASAAAKLYTPELLALATELAGYPLTAELPLRAEARSRSCGSVVQIGLALGDDARIGRIGMQVSACAIGQASAALLAQAAAGRPAQDIRETADAISAWLAGEGYLPRWPGIEVLVPARDHPGRHVALLLPWTAACEALSHDAPPR